MNIIYKSFSETGLKRKNNPDRITAHTNENISLFAVADGMGGHSKGEFASETVIKYLDALWNKISGFSGDFQTAVDMAVSALEKANTEVFRYAEAEKKNMRLYGLGAVGLRGILCGHKHRRQPDIPCRQEKIMA